MRTMQPCVFEASVTLDAPIEQVYAFHENPHNIHAISPAWLDASVAQAGAKAVVGETFSIRVGVRWFPLKLGWNGIWEEVLRPSLLVDGARKSPFRLWRHQHRFEALGHSQTRMTDHVTYLLPGGWLGKIIGETFGRWQFHFMFADRHRRTRRWARDQASGSPTG